MSTVCMPLNDENFWSLWSRTSEAETGYEPTGSSARANRVPISFGKHALSVAAFVATTATGGSVNYLDQIRPSAPDTDMADSQLASAVGVKQADREQTISESDLVAELKATLGVNMTDLASIMGVSRQTAYEWLRGGPVREVNVARLQALRDLVSIWRTKTNLSVGRLAKSLDTDGRSLIDLLSAKELDRERINDRLADLADKRMRITQRAAEKQSGLSVLDERDQFVNALVHAVPASHD